MYQIIEVKDKNIWDDFVISQPYYTFLHSWNWGEFQESMGEKIWRLGIYEIITNYQLPITNLVGAALIIKIKAKRGNFLFCPHGPLVKAKGKRQKAKVFNSILEEIKKITKEEKVDFIRIAPIWQRTEENIEIFRNLGFQEAPIFIHSEVTWELNLLPKEEELLKNMRKTTRYLIKKAQKDGVEIIKSKKLGDIEIFNQLYSQTALRHKFVPFSLEYLKKEFLAFEKDNGVLIFLGKYKNEIIASAIIIFCGKFAFYHQGASLLKYPKIPVSYLLQWEAIREAKKRGCSVYNFWGIVDKSPKPKAQSPNLRKHAWRGLTLFKMGFGGQRREFVKTQDLILSWKYWFNYIVETIRRRRRHL